jgi:hypothetical protein
MKYIYLVMAGSHIRAAFTTKEKALAFAFAGERVVEVIVAE